MRNVGVWRVAAMTIGLVQAISPAVALDFNLGLKASANISATAGLDDKTREFIKRTS